MKILGLVTLALVLFVARTSRAEFREIKASQIVTIAPEDKSAEPRILAQWDLPGDLDSMIIDGAFITMTVPYRGDEPLALTVMPLTRSWSGETASWTDGWSRVGGDFDTSQPAMGMVTERDEGKMQVDVYPALKQQLEGTAPNFGFALVSRGETASRLSTFEANDATRLADAKLIIAYRVRR